MLIPVASTIVVDAFAGNAFEAWVNISGEDLSAIASTITATITDFRNQTFPLTSTVITATSVLTTVKLSALAIETEYWLIGRHRIEVSVGHDTYAIIPLNVIDSSSFYS